MMQEYQAEKKYFTLLCPNNTSKQPVLVRIPSLVPFDTLSLLLSFLVRFAPLEEQGMDSCWLSQRLQLLCFQLLHLPHHCPTRKASCISGRRKNKQNKTRFKAHQLLLTINNLISLCTEICIKVTKFTKVKPYYFSFLAMITCASHPTRSKYLRVSSLSDRCSELQTTGIMARLSATQGFLNGPNLPNTDMWTRSTTYLEFKCPSKTALSSQNTKFLFWGDQKVSTFSKYKPDKNQTFLLTNLLFWGNRGPSPSSASSFSFFSFLDICERCCSILSFSNFFCFSRSIFSRPSRIQAGRVLRFTAST